MRNVLDTLRGMWSWWWKASNKKDEFSIFLLTVLLPILAVFWFLWNVKKPRKVIAPLPPGPRGLPLVGYLPFLGNPLHQTFTELAGVYGPIYKFWLGNKLCVVVSSPTLAKEVVRDQDAIFANRDPPIAAQVTFFGGNNIAFSSYGPEWRKMRKIFKKMLSNASLDACYALRRQEIEKAISELHNKIGTPVIVGEFTFLTAMNIIMSMLWGGTLTGEKGTNIGFEFQNAVSEFMVLVAKPNISDLFPVLARFDMLGIERKAKKISLCCEKIFDYAIAQHQDMVKAKEEEAGKNEQRKDFLQFLLEHSEHKDTATSITIIQVKALFMDVVLGGIDTTSTMVEWIMAKLLQHPKILKKVNEELTEVVGMNNVVEESHLPELHYLDAVVKETLRLHPAVPSLVPHCPSQSCILGGYTIPKGTNIFLNVWAMHRDPQYWDNPLDFQPERFLKDPSQFDFSGKNFQYMPFGSGRRICAGLPLAEKMLIYVLASFLHMFEWKLPYGTTLEFSENFGIVSKKMTPLVAIPTPRLS